MVNIVVLSLDRVHMTIQCLEGIEKAIKNVDYYVTLIDNGSKQETRDILTDFVKDKKNIRLSLLAQNIGCGFGRHLGSLMNNAEYIFYLDNDIVIEEGCLENLLDTIQRSDDIMGVCAKVITNNSDLPWKHSVLNGILIIDKVPHYVVHDRQIDVDIIHGGATLWKAETFKHARFDVACMEDWDFSMQIKQKGFRLMNCPSAITHHFPSTCGLHVLPSDEDYNKIRRDKEKMDGAIKTFYDKWGLTFVKKKATVK